MPMFFQRLMKFLKNQAFFRFLYLLIHNFEENECREKAASLTYTTALSIVPVLTVFILILSHIPSLNKFQDQIVTWIYSNLLPQTSIKLTQYFNDFAEKSSDLTFIGLLFLFITTLMLIAKIEKLFNAIWHVPAHETSITNLTLKNLFRYLIMITCVPILLGIAFILSSTVSSLSFLNHAFVGYTIDWAIGLKLFSGIITTLGITTLYWFVPTCQVSFKHASMAGILVGFLFELLKYLFGLIMINFTSYQVVYGAFAALPLLLLWIYLSWCILLLGVQLTYLLQKNTPL